jgi:hypothetical protein
LKLVSRIGIICEEINLLSHHLKDRSEISLGSYVSADQPANIIPSDATLTCVFRSTVPLFVAVFILPSGLLEALEQPFGYALYV